MQATQPVVRLPSAPPIANGEGVPQNHPSTKST